MPNPNQGASGGGGGNENSLDFLWLVVIVVVGVALIWFFGKSYISGFVLQAKYYELVGIEFIFASWIKLVSLSHLPLPVPSLENVQNLKSLVHNAGTVTFSQLVDLSSAAGQYFVYPVAAILAVIAVLVYRHNLSAKFKTIFNMTRLKKIEQPDWPAITPVLNIDLVKTDLNEGPWAMSMTPMDFCKKNNLIKIEKENQQTKITLLQGAAHRVLALQLGAIWLGADRLPIYMQALFAIFAARANRDRDGANKLLWQISASANSGKLNFTGTAELLAKHLDSKLVKHVMQRHAYVITTMASMLVLARTDGVLASAEFLWLKPTDRRLWFMLNSVGRQTAVTEITGAFSHWLAEIKMNRPLKVPMVEEGVRGLDAALQDILYEPDEA